MFAIVSNYSLQGNIGSSMRCECSISGFCARHNVDKTPHFLHLCQTRPDFFQAWEDNRGPGQLSTKDRTARRVIVKRREDIAKLGRELWEELFTAVETHEDLDRWEAKIPKYGCDCDRFYKNWKLENHLGNELSFEWKWSLKSAVNKKLEKDNLDLDEAMAVFGYPDGRVHEERNDIVAVTAISASKHSRARQQACVDSWRRFGLKVYARNTREEIDALSPFFPGLNWIVDDAVSVGYAYPTQRIQRLAWTAVELDKPVLVINSDCELRGHKDWLAFDEDNQFVGVRWNYDSGFPHVVSEFRWGLDAFSFTPRQASLIPKDFPFAIGHPVWDYAVPALMRSLGVKLNILHKPFLFHEDHPVNWHTKDWESGKLWMQENLGVLIDWGSLDFRDSLEDSGWKYSRTRWVKTS